MSKKVLLTGVAGFIGSNLLDYLLDKCDWQIVGIDNLSTGNKSNIEHQLGHARFTYIEGKCSDIKTIKPYDIIFHLAALPRIQPSFKQINDHIQANLIESTFLMELMISENHYPKFIYSGSSAIYGNPKNFPTNEQEPINCLSPYAFQKYEVEVYLKLISERYPINYVVLRYFNPYGPRSYNPENTFNAYSSVVGIFLNCVKSGLPLKITGDGSQKRDFIHVKDVASANYLASLTNDYNNDSYNVGSGQTISVLEVAKLISDSYQFIEKREGESEMTWADISKIKKVLNWNPSHLLTDYILESKNLL